MHFVWLVVPEAWSRGVSTIVSDIPVLREVVATLGGGLVAPLDAHSSGEVIDELLGDPSRARVLSEAGRNYWARNPEPGAVAAGQLAIYESIGAAAGPLRSRQSVGSAS
jgi:glycosyltransferase involved in cell wall biosynthesis